jgi:hypothetical protein
MIGGDDSIRGVSSLPRDLTDEELDSAPLLLSLDTLLIEDLSDKEADAFAAVFEA